MGDSLRAEEDRNAALKATLASLGKPTVVAEVTQSESQKKAVSALKVIDLQEKEMGLMQKVQRAEKQIEHLRSEIKEDKTDLKLTQEDIDKERSSGKAVWEIVGIGTVPYRDPFHTGLSKRTPTGARRASGHTFCTAPRPSPRQPPRFQSKRFVRLPADRGRRSRFAGGFFTS